MPWIVFFKHIQIFCYAPDQNGIIFIESDAFKVLDAGLQICFLYI